MSETKIKGCQRRSWIFFTGLDKNIKGFFKIFILVLFIPLERLEVRDKLV
jgi:hypothetical protein